MSRCLEESETDADLEICLGYIALQSGLVTPRELRRALSVQAREAVSGRLPRQLGLILFSAGVIDESDLARLLHRQESFLLREGSYSTRTWSESRR